MQVFYWIGEILVFCKSKENLSNEPQKVTFWLWQKRLGDIAFLYTFVITADFIMHLHF